MQVYKIQCYYIVNNVFDISRNFMKITLKNEMFQYSDCIQRINNLVYVFIIK